jgi:hypothetical protein
VLLNSATDIAEQKIATIKSTLLDPLTVIFLDLRKVNRRMTTRAKKIIPKMVAMAIASRGRSIAIIAIISNNNTS